MEGAEGAGEIASLLKAAGVDLDFILDEGGTVLVDGVRGITNTAIALVGTSEKVTSFNDIAPLLCAHSLNLSQREACQSLRQQAFFACKSSNGCMGFLCLSFARISYHAIESTRNCTMLSA